jgi:hypothetical protein
MRREAKEISETVWQVSLDMTALKHVETRLMRARFKTHEMVRWCLNVLHAWDPQADETWLVRSLATELSAFLQCKLRI